MEQENPEEEHRRPGHVEQGKGRKDQVRHEAVPTEYPQIEVGHEFQDIDDDALWDIVNRSYVHESIFLGIGIVSNICSIFGGIRFNTKLVGINIAWSKLFVHEIT